MNRLFNARIDVDMVAKENKTKFRKCEARDMGRRKKLSHHKGKMLIYSKPSKQLTLDSLPAEPQKKSPEMEKPEHPTHSQTPATQNKQIAITRISSETKEDKLTLEVEFRLLPTKTVFSKIRSDFWFDEKRINSTLLDIIHSFGSTNEFYLKATLDLNGVSTGKHPVKAEMYEVSSHGEKHSHAMKEATIEYLQQSRESRLRRVPMVKRVEGQGVAIVSDREKYIYREIEDIMKKDLISKQDKW